MTMNDNAPAPAPAPAPAGNDWVAALPPDLKSVVDTKGYKTPADVLTAYVNAEKLIGADKIVVPKDGVFDQAARAKLGIPEKPDGYKITQPQLPEGMEWDANFEKAALTKAHELGLTPAQVQGLIELYGGQRASEFGNLAQTQEQAREAAASALKKEWGNAYSVKLDNAAKAARMVGGDALIEALSSSGAGNNPEIIRAFAKIGAMMGEDKMRMGQASGFGLTPEEARVEAQKLMKSPGYTNKGDPEHAAIVEKVQALFSQAYPEQN